MFRHFFKVFSVASLGLSICSSTQSAPLKQELTHFYISSQSSTLMNNLRLDYIKKARGYHIQVHTYDALDNADEQVKQFKHEFKKGVPVIIDAVDPKNSKLFFEKTVNSDTPIIFVNKEPVKLDLNKNANSWFIGGVHGEAGRIQGQMIINYLSRHKDNYDHNGNGQLDIIMITGPKNDPLSKVRKQQVEEALKNARIAYAIKHDFNGKWAFEPAYTQMQNMLYKEKITDIDLIVSQNDDMALGAINAIIEDINENEEYEYMPPIFSVGGTSEAIEAMAEGVMNGTVKLDTRVICDLALSIFRGETSYEQLSKIAGVKIDSHYIYIPYHPLELER